MSNALAAYYAWLAAEARDTAATFRKFGYHASAAMLERRAEGHERRATLESKEAPQDEPTGPLGLPTNDQDDDLHTTSSDSKQSGTQRPPR